MWNKIVQPSGDVVIVGEASSPHHAWVVGALESVVHGIHAWMGLNVGLVPKFAVAMEIPRMETRSWACPLTWMQISRGGTRFLE